MPRTWRGPFATDLEKYYATTLGGSPGLRTRLVFWLFNSDFHCVAGFRLGQAAGELYRRDKVRGVLLRVAATVWRRRAARIHHTVIDRGARIGPGLMIMHRNGIYLGPVTIGDNCVLHHNVTIGERVAGGEHGVPRLGDNVWIGPGATLTGDIAVGDNVTIAAGTVLSRSVPGGALVAGNPGRVVQRDYDNRAILNFAVPKPEELRHGA